MKKTDKHSITSVFFSRLSLYAVFFGIICHISAIPSLADSNNSYSWQKAESDDQYPQLYSGNFIDSIAKSKKTYIALNMRSLDTFPQRGGEKLVYEIGWGPLIAGFAILNSQPGTTNGTIENPDVIIGTAPEAWATFLAIKRSERGQYAQIMQIAGSQESIGEFWQTFGATSENA